MYDAIFSGTPVNVPSPAGATVTSGIDKASGAEWVNVGAGWVPTSSAFVKKFVLGTTAAQAALAVITAPVTSLYRVSGYVAQATATNGTLPNITVAYTEGDTSTAIAATAVVTGTATTGIGQSDAGSLIINAKAGTTITVASTAPTTATANVKARIEFLG